MIAAIGFMALIILALLVVSAVFSAAETALTRASRGRMRQLERDGDHAARRVNRLLGDQETMIGAVLIGYNLINIICSALATSFITKVIPGGWGVALAAGVMTVLVVVFVEVLPKTLAIVHADNVARSLSGPILVAVWVLGPVITAIQWVVRHTLNLFGVQMDMQTDVLAAHQDIRGTVDYHHSEGAMGSGDRRMLGGVLDLSDMDVSEVMVHRRTMSLIDLDLPPRELMARVLESEHSRFPLFRGDAENIVGVLHSKDLLRALAKVGGKPENLDLAALAREPWFIPETTKLKAQLGAFLKRRRHFALVVDEYGALKGLVTLEDILEEIVGEIEDEHDQAIEGLRPHADGGVYADGSLTIRDLNRAMDWNLPDEDAVTIAGLVIHEAQTIPDPGQTFLFHGHRFSILRRSRNQVTALHISPRLGG